MDIPKEMKALQINKYEADIHAAIKDLQVVTKPVPIPGRGQVLIKIEASPCHPSDLLFLKGSYVKKKTLPTVPGWEGAGTVIANGGGLKGCWLKGKRVAYGHQSDLDGTWAEYCIADQDFCIPLNSSIDFEQGLFINPMTAIGIEQTARNAGHQALVQTAAASQLGRMIVRLTAKYEMPLINIVRGPQEAEILKSLGAQYILNSEDENFIHEFKELAARLKATCAFDAVAGPMTGLIANALPPKSIVYVYGVLSEKACEGISPFTLIFESKKILGFLTYNWIMEKGTFGKLKLVRDVQNLISEGILKTEIYKTVTLEEASSALEEYSRTMTLGKVIIKPSRC